METIKKIEQKIQELPPYLLEEVDDFIISKKGKKQKQTGRLKQDWAGALSQFSNQFSSIESQKKALEWRKK